MSISDRALLRRFGQLDTPRKDLRRVEDSCIEATANVSRVDGHPLKLSMNLLDRALLRRFPDAISASSPSHCTKQPEDSAPCSAASSVPPHSEVAKNSAKKRKRFIGKGNTKKASICLDARDGILQKQEQIDTPCCHSTKVAESIVPSTSLSSTSVLKPALSDFAIFCTLLL